MRAVPPQAGQDPPRQRAGADDPVRAYDTVAGHYRRYAGRMLAAEFASLDARVIDQAYWASAWWPLLLPRKLVLCGESDETQTIRTGFVPPSPAVHGLLKRVMTAKSAVVSQPPFGSSLLAAVRKNASDSHHTERSTRLTVHHDASSWGLGCWAS